MTAFLDILTSLSTAEEFLDLLGVEYEPRVVNVNRLHILKRFHDYAGQAGLPGDLPETEMKAAYGRALRRAYVDFVKSDARTEKVFGVFRQDQARAGFVPLTAIARRS